jgi:single-strand DNA-binding protein
MYNKVFLLGNLTRDPELRYTLQGTAVTTFGMATNRKYGEKEEVYFGEVTVWEKKAEACSKYLNKGSQVFVEGRLHTETFTTNSGQKQTKTKITAVEVKFLSKAENKTDKRAENAPEEHTELEPF